ncbi:BQ2448_3304 [Microbotryum intermedium]|uniref:BQ2448_3304 protein n=1 Tax=Microbotryum intermedium TaxID=269621 RepID=A0A238FKX3_9BASI|nr:BQ2448_5527 [Microbotryum intermedium]SCV71716.1 BQ2448_3304 [Microbotryum intermedium]
MHVLFSVGARDRVSITKGEDRRGEPDLGARDEDEGQVTSRDVLGTSQEGRGISARM